MSHPKWCGQTCSECKSSCLIDESISCSPDCDGLDSLTGEPNSEYCKDCEAISCQRL